MNFIITFLLLSLPLSLGAQPRGKDAAVEKLLERLDGLVADKAEYHARRDGQIEGLKKQARTASGMVRANLYKEIYGLYVHYQTDSAQVYLDKLSHLSETETTPPLRVFCRIGQAEIYSVTGLYGDAEKVLQGIDRRAMAAGDGELQLFYYRTLRTLYGWMADYTEMPAPRKALLARTMQYRDTLLAVEGGGESRDIVEADKATAVGSPSRAVEILLPHARKMDGENPDPYICFTLYQAYHAMGKAEESLHYLVLTAIADLQRGITEYEALPILAQQMYGRGEIERAYNYLICAMEDASFCKARLRAVEVSKIFPIIDKQYKKDESGRRRLAWTFTYVLVAFILVLTGGLVYLRKQMRRLHASREALSEKDRRMQETMAALRETNGKLQETCAALAQTDKVKEEYIARYLNQCRDYLDAMQENNRMVLRLFKERRMDELAQFLKSETRIKEEQERFYADFDQAFLHLFPDFIERFNALLRPGEQLVPKRPGQLNTELRIFALMRLGVSDPQRIAHFLNFSLATVYNYRSKVRGKSAGDPATFEKRVAEL